MGRSFDKGGKSRRERAEDKRKARIHRMRDMEAIAEMKAAVSRETVMRSAPHTISSNPPDVTGKPKRPWMRAIAQWIKRRFSKK